MNIILTQARLKLKTRDDTFTHNWLANVVYTKSNLASMDIAIADNESVYNDILTKNISKARAFENLSLLRAARLIMTSYDPVVGITNQVFRVKNTLPKGITREEASAIRAVRKKEYQIKYKTNNVDRIREVQRVWKQTHPEKCAAYTQKYKHKNCICDTCLETEREQMFKDIDNSSADICECV